MSRTISKEALDPRVAEYVAKQLGAMGLKLVEALFERGRLTDGELAVQLEEKPSFIRKLLYDLYEMRVAEYAKEKDKETGWLTFFWSLNQKSALYAIEQRAIREVEGLKVRRDSMQEGSYLCPVGKERFSFERASECSFRCLEHGEPLQASDNTVEIAEIGKQIKELSEFRDSLKTP